MLLHLHEILGEVSYRCTVCNILSHLCGKGSALAVAAADPDGAAHHLYQTHGDIEAEAGAFYIAVFVLLKSLEGFEEPAQILVPDTYTCIGDYDLQHLIFLFVGHID